MIFSVLTTFQNKDNVIMSNVFKECHMSQTQSGMNLWVKNQTKTNSWVQFMKMYKIQILPSEIICSLIINCCQATINKYFLFVGWPKINYNPTITTKSEQPHWGQYGLKLKNKLVHGPRLKIFFYDKISQIYIWTCCRSFKKGAQIQSYL